MKQVSVVVLFSVVALLVGVFPAAATSCEDCGQSAFCSCKESCGNLSGEQVRNCDGCCQNQYSHDPTWWEWLWGARKKTLQEARKCVSACYACGINGQYCA